MEKKKCDNNCQNLGGAIVSIRFVPYENEFEGWTYNKIIDFVYREQSLLALKGIEAKIVVMHELMSKFLMEEFKHQMQGKFSSRRQKEIHISGLKIIRTTDVKWSEIHVS